MSKKQTESKKKKRNKVESRYTHAEILEAASSFGEMPETVAGALRMTDKSELTRSDVNDLIQKFKARKV